MCILKKCLILYYFEILNWKLGCVWQMGILRQDAGNKIVSMSSPVPAVIKIVSSKLAFYSIFNSWIKTNHPPCQRTDKDMDEWVCHAKCVHYVDIGGLLKLHLVNVSTSSVETSLIVWNLSKQSDQYFL